MVPFSPSMGVAMVSPIKSINAIINIVGRVGMNNINDYSQTQAMSCVNQILEIVW